MVAVALGAGSIAALVVPNLSRLPQVEVLVHKRRIASFPSNGPGTELLLVYVGSSRCVWCNLPWLPDTVGRVRAETMLLAERLGFGFAFMGVSRDESVRAGLAHLRRMGDFDEVSTGRAWLNSVLRAYFGENHDGPLATPQLFLVVRDKVDSGGRTVIRQERIVARKVGAAAIAQWLHQGVSIPIPSESGS